MLPLAIPNEWAVRSPLDQSLLAQPWMPGYRTTMIRIRFPNAEAKRSALGQLPGRFSFKSWASGEMIVSEDALAFLAVQGIPFTVEGPATYEQNGAALRGATAVAS